MRRSTILMAVLGLTIIAGLYSVSSQVVPSNPTTADLEAVLLKTSAGILDANQVIELLSRPNACHVASLRELLFVQQSIPYSPPSQTRREAGALHNPVPAYRVLVKVLENIGSMDCFSCLYDAARIHPERHIRGFCLNSLATTFQSRAKAGTILPDLGLLYLFISQASDTLMVMGMPKRVGEIAREGLRNWTARGGSRPIPASLRLTGLGGSTESRPYWEYWWSKRSSKIKWDPESGLFIMPR